jgi:hypothetical protein
LRGAVAVFVPDLPYSLAFTYIKMPDGRLDYPAWNTWAEMYGKEDKDGEIRTFPDAGPFQILISSTDGEELRLTEEEKQMYFELGSLVPRASPLRYWKSIDEIELLTIMPPYDKLDEEKTSALQRVKDYAQEFAGNLFEPGEELTITVSNFDVGDSGTMVLLEQKHAGGAIIGVRLNTNPKHEPVMFGGVLSHDITIPRYGLPDDSPEFIKRNALASFPYTVVSNR